MEVDRALLWFNNSTEHCSSPGFQREKKILEALCQADKDLGCDLLGGIPYIHHVQGQQERIG